MEVVMTLIFKKSVLFLLSKDSYIYKEVDSQLSETYLHCNFISIQGAKFFMHLYHITFCRLSSCGITWNLILKTGSKSLV